MNSKWEMDSDRKLIFFKCTKWQFEDTLDPINCPFHYFCDSLYAGDYPQIIDVLVFFFVTVSYLTTLIAVLREIISRGRRRREDDNDGVDDKAKRYLLPSGPISLPLILLILAKGQRINTLFPISVFGPAILQLVQLSVLIFKNNIEKEASFVFFEASTISGLLHASLYLDAVILPYYTGFDALVTSTFSGVCKSCICRKEPLILGGTIVAYRGWSSTTFLVVGVLCLRIICKLCREEAKRKKVVVIKNAVEGLGWIVLIRDSVYLAVMSPVEEPVLFRVFVFGSVFMLICVYVITQVCCLVSRRQSNKTTNT
ncbi:hypothetical protein EUTSA_v10009953mg [Eutrema salsugineum]|uniref:Uncharacterized protein n=1 Tax=Eutrema salsugineum TaxID=72664 RepID=V4MWI5_EUTSA|nr:uncharacterized protein LOC18994629 [Eutrema salsugineum]ESQ36716.1 hypothetical protein EUTSA_v10009953mg [Eutrema salsugineum]